MKLVQDAEIAPEKLTRYLLVKRPVGDKSEFLKRAGYALDNWQQLEQISSAGSRRLSQQNKLPTGNITKLGLP